MIQFTDERDTSIENSRTQKKFFWKQLTFQTEHNGKIKIITESCQFSSSFITLAE